MNSPSSASSTCRSPVIGNQVHREFYERGWYRDFNRSLLQGTIFYFQEEKMENYQDYQAVALAAIAATKTTKEVNDLKVLYLGKNSFLAKEMSKMGQLSKEEKAVFGQLINSVRTTLTSALESALSTLQAAELNTQLQKERIDITLPGRKAIPGSKHPLHIIIDEITDLCVGMGYQVAEGPEVESDEMNFEKLNLPKDHPARDMQDTFYLTENELLRTQTSPVQVRTLIAHAGKGPVKIIAPGKVYRRDNDDATHSHQFHQIEGLYIDHDVSMADLQTTLNRIVRHMFGEKRVTRFRTSFFPFTEPSVEVDVSCHMCDGKGCNVCKHSGWIEVLGAGMVHPHVLAAAGFDSTRYQGFAFGMGVERITMLRYGVDDIRHFYLSDLRFISQFRKDR